jgi:hypothetical protein
MQRTSHPNQSDQIGRIFANILGDFSLSSVCEKDQCSLSFWATFFHDRSVVLILAKMLSATFWAIFFSNSSGHPDPNPPLAFRFASRVLSKDQKLAPILVFYFVVVQKAKKEFWPV